MTIIKAYKTKELAAMYDVPYKAMLEMLKKIKNLGERVKGFYLPNQVEKIFKHLGEPKKEFIEK